MFPKRVTAHKDLVASALVYSVEVLVPADQRRITMLIPGITLGINHSHEVPDLEVMGEMAGLVQVGVLLGEEVLPAAISFEPIFMAVL